MYSSQPCSQYTSPTSYFRCQGLHSITLRLRHNPKLTFSVRQAMDPFSTRVKCREKHASNTIQNNAILHHRRSPSLSSTNQRGSIYCNSDDLRENYAQRLNSPACVHLKTPRPFGRNRWFPRNNLRSVEGILMIKIPKNVSKFFFFQFS